MIIGDRRGEYKTIQVRAKLVPTPIQRPASNPEKRRGEEEMANEKTPGAPQVTPHEPEHKGSRRDPEERPATTDEVKDKMLDKTLADSFPTSDPPSSIPDPGEDDSFAA
jgi:hypothetical protein